MIIFGLLSAAFFGTILSSLLHATHVGAAAYLLLFALVVIAAIRPGIGLALVAAATPVAFTSFRTVTSEVPELSLVTADSGNVIVQVAAFWLLTSGTAILVTARRAVRTSLGALLMLTGVQLLIRLSPGPQLELTIAVAWVEVVVALVGAFLIVNERALRE